MKLRARLVKRLRPVCPDMPPEAFDQMVEEMALLELKYTLRRRDDHYPLPASPPYKDD